MAMRDLIPWRRQDSTSPVAMQAERTHPLAEFRQEFDRLFDDFLRAPLAPRFGRSDGFGWPSVEVAEKNDEVVVTAELPGLDENDIELVVDNGMLTIRGERKTERSDDERGWSERYYGRFERSVALPDGADESGCQADFENGVLTVRMPTSEEARRGRRIPIGTSRTRH